MTIPLTRREFVVLSLAGLGVFFGVWTLASLGGLAPRQFLPPPWTVAAKFVDLTHEPFVGYTLQQHLLSSFTRFGMGFVLAVAIGILTSAPVRLANLTAIKLDTNLIKPGGLDSNYWLVFPDYDVKNRVKTYIEGAGLPASRVTTTAQRVPVTVGGRTINAVKVQVSYPYDYMILGPLIQMVGGTYATGLTLKAAATMRTEVATGL